MKRMLLNSLKLSLITLSLSVTLSAFCQAYVPFPTDSARWRMAYRDFTDGLQIGTDYEYLIDGDTIINTKSYHKLLLKYYGWQKSSVNEEYGGAFRDDTLTKKIYYIRPDSTHEELLYDFDLQIGDTLANPFSIDQYSYDTLIVVKIDSVLYGNVYRKRIGFDLYYCDDFDTIYHIAGIGSNFGLLQPAFCLFEVSDYLICMTHHDSLIYSYDPAAVSCPVVTSIASLFPNSAIEKIDVFPNPANKVISLRFDGQERGYYTISIFNSLGRIVLKDYLLPGNSAIINVEALPSGIYYFRLENNDHLNPKHGKFIKN